MKCPIEMNRSFGLALAISAILVNFVSILFPTSVCGKCVLTKIDIRVACLPSAGITAVSSGTMRRSDSLNCHLASSHFTACLPYSRDVPKEY